MKMIVLMLGSGPGVTECRHWPRGAIDRIVAINNAWAVREDWDDLVYPDDFPTDRHPRRLQASQRAITSADYVPVNNHFGGIVYAGATMAFSAGYWALGVLKPKVLAYLGCDMVYGTGRTHFYGTGTADPLRPDPTLQDLRAKSARLELLAARAGCAVVNLSRSETRLTFPRLDKQDLPLATCLPVADHQIDAALQAEAALGALWENGRYWEGPELDARALQRIDGLWLAAHAASRAMQPEAQPLLPPDSAARAARTSAEHLPPAA
jgi:hypothetical protein